MRYNNINLAGVRLHQQEDQAMSINQAIEKAKVMAKKEAPHNDYGDSMFFVVYDDNYRRYIVMDEWNYELGQGIGDIDLAAASVWSDGAAVEVERYA